MEVYQGEADGRIFNSCDITLFKKKFGECIKIAKNSIITRKFFIKTAQDVLLHLMYSTYCYEMNIYVLLFWFNYTILIQ